MYAYIHNYFTQSLYICTIHTYVQIYVFRLSVNGCCHVRHIRYVQFATLCTFFQKIL